MSFGFTFSCVKYCLGTKPLFPWLRCVLVGGSSIVCPVHSHCVGYALGDISHFSEHWAAVESEDWSPSTFLPHNIGCLATLGMSYRSHPNVAYSSSFQKTDWFEPLTGYIYSASTIFAVHTPYSAFTHRSTLNPWMEGVIKSSLIMAALPWVKIGFKKVGKLSHQSWVQFKQFRKWTSFRIPISKGFVREMFVISSLWSNYWEQNALIIGELIVVLISTFNWPNLNLID